jgi:EAL domain-containing protein (putative c-di-GMP-specific phosphodiesterase class I)
VPPECFELELTESMLLKDPKLTAAKLASLRALGLTLAIDDFGTGYSSLAYLERLPVDTLKIDRSFVASLEPVSGDGQVASGTAVIRAIISLAHSLGKRVVAEGVETAAQQQFLLSIGCDFMQGYRFGRPVPADDFATAMLRAA